MNPNQAFSRSVVLIQPPASMALAGESALLTKFDAVGLLALRAYLEPLGYAVRVLNAGRAWAEQGNLDALWPIMAEAKPDLIGISMNWLHLSAGALEMAAECKRRFAGVPVVLGGQHASLFATEILRDYHHAVDGIVIGEGEETLAEVLERPAGPSEWDGIAGLALWREGKINYAPRQVRRSPEELPPYSYREIWPRPLDSEARYLAALSTTRGGCKKSCAFCLEARQALAPQRERPVHFSAPQLLRQTRAFLAEGRSFITIEDQISCHAESLIVEYIEGLIREKLHLRHLSIFVEPTAYSRAVYDLLERAPVDELVVSFGIETGSAEVSRNLLRPYDYSAIFQELEYIGRKKYFSATWWMLGLPGEGEVQVHATRDMIDATMRLGVLAHSISPLILFPQVPLGRNPEKYGLRQRLKSFEDFKIFSLVPRNETGAYPELITHESALQPWHDTLRYLQEIKKQIMENESRMAGLQEKKAAAISSYTAFRKKEIF